MSGASGCRVGRARLPPPTRRVRSLPPAGRRDSRSRRADCRGSCFCVGDRRGGCHHGGGRGFGDRRRGLATPTAPSGPRPWSSSPRAGRRSRPPWWRLPRRGAPRSRRRRNARAELWFLRDALDDRGRRLRDRGDERSRGLCGRLDDRGGGLSHCANHGRGCLRDWRNDRSRLLHDGLRGLENRLRSLRDGGDGLRDRGGRLGNGCRGVRYGRRSLRDRRCRLRDRRDGLRDRGEHLRHRSRDLGDRSGGPGKKPARRGRRAGERQPRECRERQYQAFGRTRAMNRIVRSPPVFGNTSDPLVQTSRGGALRSLGKRVGSTRAARSPRCRRRRPRSCCFRARCSRSASR